MPMNEYGEIVRNSTSSSSSTSSPSSSTSNSSSQSWHYSGTSSRRSGSGFSIFLGVVILVIAIIVLRNATKSEPSYYEPDDPYQQDVYTGYDDTEEDYTDYGDYEEYTDDPYSDDYSDVYSEYIFYDSNSRYLTTADLEGLSAQECKLARNEIFARHGRMFVDQSLQNYFDSCSWYVPTTAPDDFDDSVLNDYERANAEFILKYELSQNYTP